MTYRHTFAPGEHDEFVCKHVLSGQSVTGAVEHESDPDGTTYVDFPLSAEAVKAALLTYDRSDYEPPLVSLTPDDIAVLKEVAQREKTGFSRG